MNMATIIRPELSMKNKYWIDKHRHYELKHFCLQYPTWKKAYRDLDAVGVSVSSIGRTSTTNIPGDPTGKRAIAKAQLIERIEMVEQIAREADDYLWQYILKAVTENLSYTYLKAKLDIPCGKDMYYDRYRKFFWLLSKVRG
jgi:hypothetical protein